MHRKTLKDRVQTILRRTRTILRPVLTKRFVYGYAYNLFCRWTAIRDNHVLLESNHGKGFWRSPYALLQFMSKQACFNNWKLILVAPPDQHEQLRAAFPRARLRFVQVRSFRYAWYLATSKWLVNDVTFPIYFSRRDEQLYLNLWHGTPLKSLGRHISHGMLKQISNVQRNFLHATHLLAPNPHTEAVLNRAYMLPGLWQGVMIRNGYPSTEVLVRSRSSPPHGPGRSIAFMPTWRGTLETQDEASRILLDELRALLREIDNCLKEDETLWVRLHPMVSGSIRLDEYQHVKPFPDHISPYEHLAQCHALITDYSSVLFDFSLTGRPIILYMADKDDYLAERGFYIDPQQLPFTKAHTPDELIQAIQSLRDGIPEPSADYLRFQQIYGAWDSEHNCQRVCKAFFGLPEDAEPAPVEEYCVPPSERPVLLYTGAMVPNGITRSFMNLVRELGATNRRFVILADTSANPDETDTFLKNLPANISFVPVQLHIHVSPLELVNLAYLLLRKQPVPTAPDYLVRIAQREVRRLFGSANFQTFVNFNGYSWRAALLALGADWRRIVYVHNDMAEEVKAVKLVDPRLLELSYRYADAVALVREGIEKEYCERFYDYRHKARYVPNCLRTDVRPLSEKPLADAFSKECPAGTYEHVREMLARPNVHRFINIARFADEKGQLRLIDAFEKVRAQYPDTQLFIIGGYGPRFDDLRNRAKESACTDSIAIILGSGNPFPIVKSCNTLVFSSYYEGIGLVLFEALELGLSIISTDIPGPSEFLAQGYGTVVSNSMEGIASGMILALEGKAVRKPFDISAHNADASSAFMNMLGDIVPGGFDPETHEPAHTTAA